MDRLDEHPDFVFTRGEALIYRWIEELDPPLFARIREFVAAGRWVIVNGWWIQPDCNVPSGEADGPPGTVWQALLRRAVRGGHHGRLQR